MYRNRSGGNRFKRANNKIEHEVRGVVSKRGTQASEFSNWLASKMFHTYTIGN